MEKFTELASDTIAALMRDYFLWIGILSLILAFALYVYFFPTSIDFFTGTQAPAKPKSREAEIERRSEPVDSGAATVDPPTN